MKIYMLFHTLVDKFVPMSEDEKLNLQAGALKWYDEQLDKAKIIRSKNSEAAEYNAAHASDPDFSPKAPIRLSWKEKLFETMDSWWFRYLIAMAFIFLVPKLKAIINGETSSDSQFEDEEDHDDDEISMEDFVAFKRYMKQRRA